MELRDYQVEAVEKGFAFLTTDKKPENKGIIIAPTGSGKSLIVAKLAEELKHLGGVLTIQFSKELLEQNFAKFTLYGGNASIFSASLNTKEVDTVTFSTIGSLKDKQKLFEHVKYVIVDECHLVPPAKVRKNKSIDHSMFTAFIAGLDQSVKILGLTATAFRLKKFNDPFTGAPFSQINLLNRMRPMFFNKIVDVTQISELYEKGFLCPIKYIPLHWDDGALKVNTTGAEYTEESIDRALIDQGVIRRIPNIVEDSIAKGRKHRLVFVSSVADAEYLAGRSPDSACVSAETKSKVREEILEQFKSGKIKTVYNVGVLTIGFDFPALDTIIIARPTMSLALYMQMIGRGIRLSEGKVDCAVVDMCGNYNRFGEIESIHYRVNAKGLWELANKDRVLSNVKIV